MYVTTSAFLLFENFSLNNLFWLGSSNFQMVHGGTNFGFYNGANTGGVDEDDYQPDLTSYDYVRNFNPHVAPSIVNWGGMHIAKLD